MKKSAVNSKIKMKLKPQKFALKDILKNVKKTLNPHRFKFDT